MYSPAQARVIFGDSRHLESLVSPASIDLIVSGPPYWNEIVYSHDDGQLSAINDYQVFLDSLTLVWQGADHVLRPGGLMCLWLHDFFRTRDDLQTLIPFHADVIGSVPKSLRLRCLRIWDRYLHKIRPITTFQPHQSISTRFQYILIFQKNGRHTNSDLIETALQHYYWQPVWHHKTTPRLLGSHRLFRLAFHVSHYLPKSLLNYLQLDTFLRDDYTFRHYVSECPPDIAAQLISDFSRPGDTILDPFLGSGTSLGTAIELHRNFIGVEINKNTWPAIQEKNQGIVIHNNL